MDKKVGKHFLESGRVQGVFYRAGTIGKALQLGIEGWVQNLNDGRVEVKAFGTEEQLKKLHEWLQHGPPAAKVDRVEVKDIDLESHQGFTKRS